MRLSALFLLIAVPSSAIDLAVSGRSAYTISVPARAIPSETRAATELQRFLEEMSGARLPIVSDDRPLPRNAILLGDNAHLRSLRVTIPLDTLGGEGSVIRTAGRHLIIAGGRPRGTLYGVYALLDKLGCRWYTREVSRIPKHPTIRLAALDETHKPAFEYREPFFTEAFEKDWAARNRTNGDHQLLDESTGGRLRYHPFVHSFNEILPPEKYFKDHPEYFSFIDGKRRAERSQLCLTNPDVRRLTVERVLGWIREHPDVTIFSVSQNDWEGWCECDRCRRVEEEEGNEHSGPLLRFVNEVAGEVAKSHPDKLIDTLAYWYTERPPAKVRPLPNVRIRLCPIGVCEAHPYDTCPRSAYFMKNLRAWSAITNQLYIWHYNTNFAHYLMPFPDFDELAANIPLYKQNGVVGIFLEGAYAPNGGGENAELRSWVMARQLWDTSTTVDRAVDEFLGAVYGAAAKPMRAYYDLLHGEVRMPPQGRGRHIWIFALPDFSPELTRNADELFRQAEQMADSEAVRARVRKARLPVDYLKLLYARRFDIRDRVYAPADLGAVKDQFQTLLAKMRSFGITSIHEGRNLDYDEKEYAAFKPLAVTTLESTRYRADVVPELNGRVIRLIDKATNRNLLRATDPGERGYPDVGGLAVTLHADYQARPWPVRWTSASDATRSEMVLTGQTENGRRIRHTLRLTDEGLSSEATLETAGDAVLKATAEFDPGDIDSASVRFRKLEGDEVVRKLIEPEQEPTGNAWLTGASLPGGEWFVENPAWRARAVQGFTSELTERASLSFSAKGQPRAALAAWSKMGALRLTTTYGLR